MIKIIAAIAVLFAVASPAPAPPLSLASERMPTPSSLPASKPDRFATTAYDPAGKGVEQVDVALRAAQTMRRNLVVVLGANWCHDSAALANDIAAAPLLDLFSNRLDVVFIDVGRPKVPGKGRNLDVARRFGIAKIEGTPTVLIVSPDGTMLNSVADAKSWRNAASRKHADVQAYFQKYAQR